MCVRCAAGGAVRFEHHVDRRIAVAMRQYLRAVLIGKRDDVVDFLLAHARRAAIVLFAVWSVRKIRTRKK